MSSGWLRQRLGKTLVDVHWAVQPGQIVALFGPSGAGKSTTLRAIAGLSRPAEGHIEIGGQVVFDSASGRWLPPHLRRTGYLPQQLALFPHLTIRQNIIFALPSQDSSSARVDALLEGLHIADLATRYPNQVSVGQQQRAALARAIARQPDVLLLDEPFSALDLELRRELRRELRGIRDRERIPILLVTHDVEDALALSDGVIALDHGHVVAEGPPLEVLQRPAAERLSRLIEVENVFEGTVREILPERTGLICEFNGAALEIPYAEVPLGAPVRVGIRSGDILLATQPPQGLSARNVLAGRLTKLEPHAFGVEAHVEAGSTFRVQLTQRAVASLALRPGMQLWLVIKSNSCFLIE